jgi:hypothetical protein
MEDRLSIKTEDLLNNSEEDTNRLTNSRVVEVASDLRTTSKVVKSRNKDSISRIITSSRLRDPRVSKVRAIEDSSSHQLGLTPRS